MQISSEQRAVKMLNAFTEQVMGLGVFKKFTELDAAREQLQVLEKGILELDKLRAEKKIENGDNANDQ